jgi:hypothetical protein
MLAQFEGGYGRRYRDREVSTVEAAKVLYASLYNAAMGTVLNLRDGGTVIDRITPESWAAGQLTEKERAALVLSDNVLDNREFAGELPPDTNHVIELEEQGTELNLTLKSLRIDTDPETGEELEPVLVPAQEGEGWNWTLTDVDEDVIVLGTSGGTTLTYDNTEGRNLLIECVDANNESDTATLEYVGQVCRNMQGIPNPSPDTNGGVPYMGVYGLDNVRDADADPTAPWGWSLLRVLPAEVAEWKNGRTVIDPGTGQERPAEDYDFFNDDDNRGKYGGSEWFGDVWAEAGQPNQFRRPPDGANAGGHVFVTDDRGWVTGGGWVGVQWYHPEGVPDMPSDWQIPETPQWELVGYDLIGEVWAFWGGTGFHDSYLGASARSYWAYNVGGQFFPDENRMQYHAIGQTFSLREIYNTALSIRLPPDAYFYGRNWLEGKRVKGGPSGSAGSCVWAVGVSVTVIPVYRLVNDYPECDNELFGQPANISVLCRSDRPPYQYDYSASGPFDYGSEPWDAGFFTSAPSAYPGPQTPVYARGEFLGWSGEGKTPGELRELNPTLAALYDETDKVAKWVLVRSMGLTRARIAWRAFERFRQHIPNLDDPFEPIGYKDGVGYHSLPLTVGVYPPDSPLAGQPRDGDPVYGPDIIVGFEEG